MRGTVDRVVPEGSYGFIVGPNGEEYFFHQSGLSGPEFGELGPGVAVLFDVTEGEGDAPDEHLRAVDIRLDPESVAAVDNEPLPPGKLSGGAV